MNKKYVFFLFIPFILQSIPSKKELVSRYKKQKNKVFLLSYPRSGNTWMRYCLEFLTRRPTLEYLGGNEFPGLNKWWPFSMKYAKIDISKNIIWKIHFRYSLKAAGHFDENTDKLILLLRDYKEALIRNKDIHIFDGNFFRKKAVQKFLDNLVLFDEWNSKNRLLIHYEDLIRSPKQVFQEVLDFIGEDDIRLEDFMNNFDVHKKRSLSFYSSNISQTQTYGESIVHHSKKLTIARKRQIDSQIAQRYPFLWEYYLSIYRS